MLKKWVVKGFKSFGSEAAIDLAPLTIFAGANSSGKSTFLQSILLLKQTVQYGSINRSLALNGPLLRLGTFDDIVHFDSVEQRVYMDFHFQVENPRNWFSDRPSWIDPISRHHYPTEGQITDVKGSFTWEPREISGDRAITDKLQASLNRGELAVDVVSLGKSPAQRTRFFAEYSSQVIMESGESFSPLRVSRLDEISEKEITADKPDPRVIGAAPNYFLPGFFYVSFDSAKKKAKDIAEAICSRRTTLSSYYIDDEEDVPVQVADLVYNFIVERNGAFQPFHPGASVIELSNALNPYKSSGDFSRLLLSFNSEPDSEILILQKKIEGVLSEYFPQKHGYDSGTPRHLSAASEFVKLFLRNGVRYLGPLRDPPKAVYPAEALENTTDVGYRGEHTAAILYLHGNTSVRYISPVALQEAGGDAKPKNDKLVNAVTEWLQYMGIAIEIIAEDVGRFGNQLRVKTQGSPEAHDLTNVGVGVSQVVPIVVSALLAARTSLLIYEQPELHLHPKVQARLADFFYATSLAGKQCLLETHSEYMIDRFRLRIAQSKADTLKRDLKIYFTERLRGQTICKPVEISKYGAILDWPAEFFEQSQIETRNILEAAAAKRKNEKNQPQ